MTVIFPEPLDSAQDCELEIQRLNAEIAAAEKQLGQLRRERGCRMYQLKELLGPEAHEQRKISPPQEATGVSNRQPWARAAEDWVAVVASWIAIGYGMGWGLIILMGTGPGPAFLHLVRAFAIAMAVMWTGRKVIQLMARRS